MSGASGALLTNAPGRMEDPALYGILTAVFCGLYREKYRERYFRAVSILRKRVWRRAARTAGAVSVLLCAGLAGKLEIRIWMWGRGCGGI